MKRTYELLVICTLTIWAQGLWADPSPQELARKIVNSCSMSSLGIAFPPAPSITTGTSINGGVEYVDSVRIQALIAEHRLESELRKRHFDLIKIDCVLNVFNFHQAKICPNAYAFLIADIKDNKWDENPDLSYKLNAQGIDPLDFPSLSLLRQARDVIFSSSADLDESLTVNAIDAILEARTGRTVEYGQPCQSSAYVDEKMRNEIRVKIQRAQERLNKIIESSGEAKSKTHPHVRNSAG